jgi:hypothetical protein
MKSQSDFNIITASCLYRFQKVKKKIWSNTTHSQACYVYMKITNGFTL